MHFLAVSLRKDWARTRRDPFQFLVSLGIPLVLDGPHSIDEAVNRFLAESLSLTGERVCLCH